VPHAGHPRTSSRLAVATSAPYAGAFSYTAHSMLGTVKSLLKIGLPVTMARLSTPGVALPMIRVVLRVLEGDRLRVGRRERSGTCGELAVAGRAVRRGVMHTARPRLEFASGTPHVAAAAAISMCRPTAPAWRSGSQLTGVLWLPPALCGP
jgi:hypothetical protein